jgi:predicted XRE-type DNA-binding protein
MTRTYATVWDAIKDTPEEAVAIKRRADVMIAITGKVEGWKVTQREAARRLGITQPRLNELLKGRISRFSLDALMALADHAGLMVKIAIRNRGGRPAVRSAAAAARSRHAPSVKSRKKA